MLLPWIWLLQGKQTLVYSSQILHGHSPTGNGCSSPAKNILICDEDIESVKIQGVNYNFDNYTKHEGTEYDVINLFDDTDISSWSLDTNALKRFLVDQNSKPLKK